ncbi:hypothetical protein FRC01_008481 [Tulasnella sp. 417]|nr:hypothetical protein FRC01_008481 [Tulasnella sp. 417]
MRCLFVYQVGNKKLYRTDMFNQARSELVGEDGSTKKELKDGVAHRLQKLSRMMYDVRNAVTMWLKARAHTPQMENRLLSEDRETKYGAQVSYLPRQMGNATATDKLVEQGWGRDDVPILLPKWDNLLYKPTPLTDQTWRRIYAKLIPLLEPCRAERLSRERRERHMDLMADLCDL